MDDVRRTIDELCAVPARAACTDAERRAAGRLHDRLRAAGHEAWMETVWVRPQRAWSLALHSGLAVVGSLVAIAAPVAGLAVAALGTVGLVAEAAGYPGPLRLVMRRRATQNVLVEPGDRSRIALLIVARYDAPRAGVAVGERPRAWAAPLGGARAMRWWLALCGVALTSSAAARVAGVDGVALGWAQLVPTIVLLVATAAAADAALAPVTPGANDNASGVAAALALHDRLSRRPLARLSPGLMLHGDLRAHLRRERLDPTQAIVVELGPCGGGTPVWHARHPTLHRAARATGGGAADGRGAGRRRLPTLAIACVDARGIVPRAHTAADTPDAVDLAAVEAAVALAGNILAALDAELT